MMKKILLYLLLLLCPLGTWAQSSLTDNQVAAMVEKEIAKGTSQSQIVIKLMQQGVDISQIRRVREKMLSEMNNGGIDGLNAGNGTGNRLRTNNGNTKDNSSASKSVYDKRSASTMSRMQAEPSTIMSRGINQNDDDYLRMQDEVSMMMPVDSTELFQQLLEQQKEDKRKVFGRDIFNNEYLTFEPAMNIATPQNYKLGPGDAVIIDIYGASQKTVETTVSPDGEIVVEGFGPIQVSGLSVAQANARIRSRLGARYQSSRIKISLGQTRTITVNVMGEVKTPGTYTLSAFASVFHALYMAGGTNDIGTLRNIKIYRNNRLVSVCDIYDYILNGKMTGNVRLADGDVIIVGPYDCLVNIRGKVKRPMFYEMKRNESLETLLRYAGGFTGDAYRKAVRVNRKTGHDYTVFNVGEFDMSNFRIADGDSVSVDSILSRYSNTVEVKGAVFRPGLYQLGDDIHSVRTLIQHAEGVTEGAFTVHAVMHRMNPDRTLRVISVDLEGIMSGKLPDIPLQENDVLFVPTKREGMVQRTITIRGEVQYPGIYQYADNETIEDFILQAGGLTEKASTAKVTVGRRVNDPSALVPDSIVGETYELSLKDGFVVDGQPGFTLMPFDEVYVYKSPAFSSQQNVTIEGEVPFPGIYTLSKRNARLTDLLKMAGGTTDLAYIRGARLERKTNDVERARMEAAYKMAQDQQQQELLTIAASLNGSSLSGLADKDKKQQLEKFVVPSSYSVGIELDKALADSTSDANIILREGDRLVVPKYNATVKINGAVMYPNTVAFESGKSARYYINEAGGFSQNARKSGAFIIYMNGRVAKVSHGAKVEAGCEIVVPSRIRRRSTPQEIIGMGSSFTSIAAMIATIANMIK